MLPWCSQRDELLMEYNDAVRQLRLGLKRLRKMSLTPEAVGNLAAARGIIRGLRREFEQHCNEHGCSRNARRAGSAANASRECLQAAHSNRQ